MSHHFELDNYICSAYDQIADSPLTCGYCSQNSKHARDQKWLNYWILHFFFFFLISYVPSQNIKKFSLEQRTPLKKAGSREILREPSPPPAFKPEPPKVNL